MSQVFISYSRRDIEFVQRLAEDLQAAGLTVWYDLSGLDGGTQWGIEIQSAIENSQYFLVVLSPSSLASKWVQREFLYAEDFEIKVIPLQYQPCRLPMWLRDVQLIDMQGENYRNNFGRLLKSLGVGQPMGKKPAKEEMETKAGLDAGAIEQKAVQEKQARLAEEERLREQARQEQIATGIMAQKEAEAKDQQEQQEKLRQAKIEQKLRKQAEREKIKAVNQARRAEAWQKWKPRLPRLAGFVGLGLLGILVIAGLYFLLPLLTAGKGTVPQPSGTAATVTPRPSLITIASPTITNTATLRPTATATPLPSWVTGFSEPILNAIGDRTPDFLDDFSTINPDWNLNIYNPGIDCSNSLAGVYNEILRLKADPGGCYAKADLSSGIKMVNFVIQVDVDFEQLSSGYSVDISMWNNQVISLSSDGQWSSYACISECKKINEGKIKINTADPVTINYVTFGYRNAFYVNKDPVAYFDQSVPGTNHWFGLSVSGEGVSSNNMVEIDNVKIWDLDQVPGLADLLK